MMAKVGRKEKLDELKKGQCTALLAAGCSKAEMARQLQVSLTTIRNAMQRDPEFAVAVQRAEAQRQVNQLQRIHTISDRSWRAAAWKLHTLHPQDYPRQGRGVLSRRQMGAVLTRFAATILPFIRAPNDRKKVRAQLKQLANDLESPRLASRALWGAREKGRPAS